MTAPAERLAKALEEAPILIRWLRGLADEGGKGVVDNLDARALGRVADTIAALAQGGDNGNT